MNAIKEVKIISLDDGKTIKLNENNLSIELCNKVEVLDSIELKYPSAGYGGGAIHLSPSKRKIVFTYYSGQSEEAFSVFELSDKLKVVYESEYYFGEAASYCLNLNESLLVQALPRTCTEWWIPWEDGDLEEDGGCSGYFEFCDINILNFNTLELSRHVIRVKPAKNWRPPSEAKNPFLFLKFSSENQFSIDFPWGSNTLSFPLPKLIAYELLNN